MLQTWARNPEYVKWLATRRNVVRVSLTLYIIISILMCQCSPMQAVPLVKIVEITWSLKGSALAMAMEREYLLVQCIGNRSTCNGRHV